MTQLGAHPAVVEVPTPTANSPVPVRSTGASLAIAGHRAAIAGVRQRRVRRRLHGAWNAVDAGLIINPDGLINQIEGGIIRIGELDAA